MVHVDDVIGVEADVLKEEYKLRGAYRLGDIDSDDFEAIWGTYRSLADARGGWDSATTKRSRLSNLRVAATAADSILDLSGPSDVEELVGLLERDWIQSKNPSPITVNGYISAIKAVFEWADAEPEYGDYSWFESIKQRERPRSRKDPEEMLGEEDIARLREHCKFDRDGTFVEFVADTGLRRTAALQLRIQDVDLDDETYRVNPDGAAQKGVDGYEIGRWPLKDSAFFLRRWINKNHPEAPNPDPDAPLFPKVEGYYPERREECAASPKAVGHQIRLAAERAGIEKPVNIHSFRHACVKRLRWKYEMDWDVIRDRVAWSEESLGEMMNVYGRLDADERVDRMKRQFGDEVDDELEEPATPEPCPNCGTSIEPAWSICPRCYVDPDEWTREGREGEARRLTGRLDDEAAARVNDLLDKIEADPELRGVLYGGE